MKEATFVFCDINPNIYLLQGTGHIDVVFLVNLIYLELYVLSLLLIKIKFTTLIFYFANSVSIRNFYTCMYINSNSF